MDKYGMGSIFDLSGKTAIITGATKGIGKEFAFLLARNGVNVALIARHTDLLEEVKEQIEKFDGNAYVLPMDLTETSKIIKAVEEVHEQFGSIDILVNNAGLNIAKPSEELTINDWDKVMDLNLKSTFFMTQAVGKYMKYQKRGKVINISSQMAFVGYFDRAAYSTSKGGLTQLTKALAIEWAEHNININAIAPTFIETEMTRKMFEDRAFKNE